MPLARKKSRQATILGCCWKSISAFASPRKRRNPSANYSSQSALLERVVVPSRTASSDGRYSLIDTT